MLTGTSGEKRKKDTVQLTWALWDRAYSGFDEHAAEDGS